MTFPALISVFTILIGLFISGKALLSKSDLEQVFLTHEQKIKMYFYRLVGVSFLTAFLVGDLYVLWNITMRKNIIETINWNNVISLSLGVFITSVIFFSVLDKVMQIFFFKHHYKFKVNLDIGEVYILRMMNNEICICSTNPHADLLKNDEDSMLIKLEDLIKKPLFKEKHEVPQKTFWKKILDI